MPEWVLDWLPGFEGSRPVRVGNVAAEHEQLDVYGEVMDAMYQARRHDVGASLPAWELGRHVLGLLEERWREPDEGIWEVRGGRRHFTHSKVMVWVAFDRAIKLSRSSVARGRSSAGGRSATRSTPRSAARPGTRSLARSRNPTAARSWTRACCSCPRSASSRRRIPASAAPSPPCNDSCSADGFLLRYRNEEDIDGLPFGEGTFLPCSFWLVDALALDGRHDEAAELFEHLLGVRNDVGLLAEEYDPRSRRLLGNFPQAFSHIALVNSAITLARAVSASVTPERDLTSASAGPGSEATTAPGSAA